MAAKRIVLAAAYFAQVGTTRQVLDRRITKSSLKVSDGSVKTVSNIHGGPKRETIFLINYMYKKLMSQRVRAMLCVIEYFAMSLNFFGNGTIRQIAYEFLLAFPSNYGPVLYHFRDKVRYWLKI